MEEPAYCMGFVPRCARDLSGSVVQKITSRDAWLGMLGEIVQLCNEAKERQRGQLRLRPFPCLWAQHGQI